MLKSLTYSVFRDYKKDVGFICLLIITTFKFKWRAYSYRSLFSRTRKEAVILVFPGGGMVPK